MHAETFFGEVRELGYTVQTRSGQRRRVRSGNTDLPALFAEFTGQKPCKLGRRVRLGAEAARWDAGFHAGPEARRDTINDVPDGVIVSDVARLVDERRNPGRGKADIFDYIEISDVDGRTGLVGHQNVSARKAPSRARKVVRAGDVLVSTVRPERGAIAVVPSHLDGAVCSTGFAVLRCKDVHPGALAWLLKSDPVKRQMVRHNIGIAYPTIAEETCLALLLPATRSQIDEMSITARRLEEAQAAFETARRDMMMIVGIET